MEGTRERYERALRWRAAEKLEKSRAKIWTNIAAIINKAKICESNAKRDTTESWRDRELMVVEMEDTLNSLI